MYSFILILLACVSLISRSYFIKIIFPDRGILYSVIGERGGLVVNASDSGYRGRVFEPHSGQTALCP